MQRSFLTYILLGVLPFVFSGCALISDLFTPQQDYIDASNDRLVQWIDAPRVRVGVELIIQVSVPDENAKPNLMKVQVDQAGEITLSYLLTKPVYCDGLTKEALKEKLTTLYQTYINRPQVTVEYAPFSSQPGVTSPYGFVTVLGEVNAAGPVNIPQTQDLTVTKAIQMAGGLRPFADKERIRVSHCERDGRITRTMVNLNEIGERGLIDKDIKLKPGDVVFAHEVRW